jgi:hypothetical protein
MGTNYRSEQDGWGYTARNIRSEERLSLIRGALEKSPIILEHWFYRMGRRPERKVFDDFEDFTDYLATHVQPGDALHVWRFDQVCRNDNALTSGKYPDTDGMVPERGAYCGPLWGERLSNVPLSTALTADTREGGRALRVSTCNQRITDGTCGTDSLE